VLKASGVSLIARPSKEGIVSRKAIRAGAAGIALLIVAFGSTAAASSSQTLTVKIVVTNSYFVDNGAPDLSPGDVVGSSGRLVKKSQRVGSYGSVCTVVSTSPKPLGHCEATFALGGRGRLEVAGRFNFQDTSNLVSIVGGTGDFRDVGGTATIEFLGGQGAVQRVTFNIIR
jgi:hypothetical protein